MVKVRLMKPFIFLLLTTAMSFSAQAQNKKPRIVGQAELATKEETPIRILMSQLEVEDRDDWFYPWGFTLQVYPGQHYFLQDNVVIPEADFTGELVVQVTVNDGQDDSNKFNLKIDVTPVNDQPVITGHNPLSTNEEQPVTIQLDDLKVTDPDDAYPKDFKISVHAGNDYRVDGNTVTPAAGFTGELSVIVTVNDGEDDSDPYSLPIQVKAINRVPKITGQARLEVAEDASLSLKLADLTVEDADTPYPDHFTLLISEGANYTLKDYTITPASDFFGTLKVTVTVNDGKNTSAPFNLSITVTPVEDAPRITNLETTPIMYPRAANAVNISASVMVTEADGDSIMMAEVGIRPDHYQKGAEELVYTESAGSKIRGVFDSDSGILTLLGQASPGAYARALQSLQYHRLADVPGDRVIFLRVNDGKSDSETLERNLLSGEAVVNLDIPSGFTPNGDLANDTWKIVPLKSEEEFLTARIRVYNKAGVLVYEAVGFENEWDGRMNGELLPADTYFYTIDLNLNSPAGYVKGLVTILR